MECGSDSKDIEQRHISLATFDLSHVRAVDPSCVGKRLLRQPASFPSRPHSLAERL